MKSYFTGNIIDWHLKENKRIMPWKGEKDPYKIWVSEIILQQTRVTQGLSYYNNFIDLFPTLASLAKAPDEKVFKAWEGLGYYSRCKNLLFTARYITDNLGGKFPEKFENMLQLKGIGPYTAAAISSFAYGLPHAVVDGNVFRVLARFFGEAAAVDSKIGKQVFSAMASDLLYKKDPAAYNQAIMDFGATICKPQIPECANCVLRRKCIAYNSGRVDGLPVKEKRLKRSTRFFTYFIFVKRDSVLVRKRTGKDIWENLHEFYLFESEKEYGGETGEIKELLLQHLNISDASILDVSRVYRQQLTHQEVFGKFIKIKLSAIPATLAGFFKMTSNDLSSVAFPRLINHYLQDNPL
jgi:A/G-specific adenine glycosylase